jgi:hypothetical protein
MKKNALLSLLLTLFIGTAFSQVSTTYLWHMDQPIYWPEKGLSNPKHYQCVKESQDLKSSSNPLNYGGGSYHPLNDLYEIFAKPDRVAAYQYKPGNTVGNMTYTPDAGAQVSYSGCLIENVNSLANAGQWGYYSGWVNNFVNARALHTSGGFPRLDLVGFSGHHALSPLVSERTLKKEIEYHKYLYGQNFGTSPVYSKGYWPAECAFSERIIKALVEEGFEWSVIPNSHLARTLADYPMTYGTSGCNIDPPNKADKVAAVGTHWWAGQIDGRGGTFAAPYCYQAHKAKYVDPETGMEYKITVVPMSELLSYRDGFSQQGTGDIKANIVPYNDNSHKSIVLLAHDGDNAWGGGSSYYDEAVPSFVGSANSDPDLHPSTIQQFLHDNPVSDADVVHIEDGAWFNAENDWGHPQFINWFWPLYNNTTYKFNPDAWTEDARNWAVITAVENYVLTAEDLAGGTNIANIVNSGSSSSNAEIAWHFFLGTLNSGYMYYGKSLDMEVKETVAGNNAIQYAQNEINNHPGTDNIPPSVFIPQRFPYNPGGRGFGPIYGYKEFINSKDFTVWTYGYDVSGINTAVLKYRCDADGVNSPTDNLNETYAGGAGVGSWISVPMTKKISDPGNVMNDPDINFFVLPTAIADLYYADITGLSDTLVDYYVEMSDMKGNTFKTPIQHVFVGNESSNSNPQVSWTPTNPTINDFITITSTQATATSKLHWGVTTGGTSWTAPNVAYWGNGTTAFDAHAVETPFTDPDADGIFTVTLGPFNNVAQVVSQLDFVIKIDVSTWNNNNGSDYHVALAQPADDNPIGSDQAEGMAVNQSYTFSGSDFYFMGTGGALFAGINVINSVSKGSLTYGGNPVSNGSDCADVGLLTFTPASGESGVPYTNFTFKVKDDQGRYSDNTYTMTLNVNDSRPTGKPTAVNTLINTDYTFATSDFPFTGQGGATFAGIQITVLPTAGTLTYNSSPAVLNTDYSDVSLLTFSPSAGATGSPYSDFWFKVKDSQGRYSSNSYKATVNVLSQINSGVSWAPTNPTSSDIITVFVKDDPKMNTSGKLHWGVGSSWTAPIAAYWPSGTTTVDAASVETLFTGSGNLYSVKIGPLNNPAQPVTKLNFVLHYSDGTWNNNSSANWIINVTNTIDVKALNENQFTISPVPFSDFTKISIQSQGTFTMMLIDISGKTVTQRNINTPTEFIMQRNNLKAGVYFLRFIDRKTKQTVTKSVIIK